MRKWKMPWRDVSVGEKNEIRALSPAMFLQVEWSHALTLYVRLNKRQLSHSPLSVDNDRGAQNISIVV